MQIVGNGDK